MSSARHEYQKFLTWLHAPERGASDDARRLANLVEANFDNVMASTRAQSRRSAVLAAVARTHLNAASSEPPSIAEGTRAGEWPWKRLDSLTVGPFRGFRAQETFVFPKRVTMFYGPNGTGKTSLCEALELALLGSVDEASAKRIPPQRYFANLHEGRFVSPALVAGDGQGGTVGVSTDSEANRFCFIEKNRIDNFSRIAAKTAGEKRDLIASLFGMEQFHDFVANFNESMDGQLGLVAVRKQELTTLRAQLQREQLTVDGQVEAAQQIGGEEDAYAAAYLPGLSYGQLLVLIGTEEAPGRLKALTAQLDAAAPALYDVSRATLQSAYQAADAAQAKLIDVNARLAAKTGETSFQNLYSAVLALQTKLPGSCPACGTPISGEQRVRRDPYVQAREGLAQLRELAALQGELSLARNGWNAVTRELESVLRYFGQRVGAAAASQDARQRYLHNPGADAQTAWWQASYQAPQGGTSMAQQLLDLAADCERIDAQTRVALADRAELARERDRLVQAAQAVAAFQARHLELVRQVTKAKHAIAIFDDANAKLIAAAEVEATVVAFDQRIKAAYDEFLRLLRQFRAELPGTLIAGLNTVALEIYNEFNRRDHEGDKLADLRLPTGEDGRIELAFRSAAGNLVDALHVLSEGHVRCLGVAILLAKALDVRAPTIIFDDAINAIDTEHREGIRESIFQSDRFASTQIIVTCHSSEFIKDLQNHMGAGQWTSYMFMPHRGDHRARIAGSEYTFNYMARARTALDVGDWRNALGPCRQALELVSDKIWKWMDKAGHGSISILLTSRNSEPGLRNICEALNRELGRAHTFVHPDKPAIIDGLGKILGVPERTNIWTYLNKGTHEESNREDYDPGLVRTIVECLESLDQLQLRTMTAAMAGAAQEAVAAVATTARPGAGR